jgi:hypothetical protein
MLKHWRTFGCGAAVLGSTFAGAGCTHFCGHRTDVCRPEPEVCETDCQHGHGIIHPCCWRLTGWLHRRSNAIPETLPLGKLNEAWYYEMQTNAEAADFIIHDLDFVGQTTELTSDGKDHILEIAARMRSAPFPVIVERSPNNADPELDLARRNLVIQVLCDLGNPDAAQRVFVGTPYGPGYRSPQAQQMYYRHILHGNVNAGGNMGTFGGGGIGFGY